MREKRTYFSEEEYWQDQQRMAGIEALLAATLHPLEKQGTNTALVSRIRFLLGLDV